MKTEYTREELKKRAGGCVARFQKVDWVKTDLYHFAQALLEAYEEIEGLVDALVWLSYEQQCKCWCKKPARPSERMGVPHDNTCKRIAIAFHNRHALLQGKESK